VSDGWAHVESNLSSGVRVYIPSSLCRSNFSTGLTTPLPENESPYSTLGDVAAPRKLPQPPNPTIERISSGSATPTSSSSRFYPKIITVGTFILSLFVLTLSHVPKRLVITRKDLNSPDGLVTNIHVMSRPGSAAPMHAPNGYTTFKSGSAGPMAPPRMAKFSRPSSSGSTTSNLIAIGSDGKGGAELPLLPTNMHEALVLINSLMVEIEEARNETQRATTGSGTLGEELEKALEHCKELELKLAQSNRELLIERANVQNAVLHKEQATKAYEGAHEALKIAVDRVEQMSQDLAKAKNAIEKANFKTDQFEQMCKDLAKAQNALDEANFKKDALSLNLSQYQMKVKTAFDENEKMAKELLDLRAYQRTSLNAANAHVADLEKRLQHVWEVLEGQSKVQQSESEIHTQEKDELKTKIFKMEEQLKGANESAEEQVMYLACVMGRLTDYP
jgi:hypothetical protein